MSKKYAAVMLIAALVMGLAALPANAERKRSDNPYGYKDGWDDYRTDGYTSREKSRDDYRDQYEYKEPKKDPSDDRTFHPRKHKDLDGDWNPAKLGIRPEKLGPW